MKTACIGMAMLLLTAGLLALPPSDYPGQTPVAGDKTVDNVTFIDANRILMFVTNHGNFGRDLSGFFGYDYGTFFPYSGDTSAIRYGDMITSPLYAAGLWVGGKVDGQVRVALAEYNDEYVPGSMNGDPSGSPRYRVYKIYADSLESHPSSDYLQWPIIDGAPVDGEGHPRVIGQQTLWSVFNDADPDQHENDAGMTEPLGIEVQQTVWATEYTGPDAPNGSSIYLQYKLYNKSDAVIDSCYVALWSDPDLGGSGDDLVGCDTLHDLFFCYNADNDDNSYGTTPPAIGFKLLYGPVIPSANDTAFFDGALMPGRKNMRMTSFQIYVNGTDPDNYEESFNYMRGLDRDGAPLANGTHYAVPGDPVTAMGDLDTAPADRRMMGTCGPFTFNPGDSQYVLIKMAVGQGTNRLTSITKLREILNAPPYLGITDFVAVVRPEPQYYFYQNAITPMMDTIFVGRIGGDPIGDVDLAGLRVNGDIVPTSVGLLPGHAGFLGEVLQIVFPAKPFIAGYGQLWGTTMQPFAITGGSTSAGQFTVNGTVRMIGH
ncbi:MAG: hypothetical protein PHR28_13030, partial [candidate division Zixibacteria bacterium]|nr:hypothetical protein [candidate division Zixibacteria bacterium]